MNKDKPRASGLTMTAQSRRLWPMSAIASFYLIAERDLGALLANAWPERVETFKRRFFVFPSRAVRFEDRLPWFLEQHAVELSEFPATGFAFLDLEAFLNLHQMSIHSKFHEREREEISQYGYGTVSLHDHDAARATLAKLRAFSWDTERYNSFLESGRSLLRDDSVALAFDQYKEWLGAVETGKIGVFVLS
jgi:hypothetical protein